jgi:LmbE family N-acetylglucosaminyl deacetylase
MLRAFTRLPRRLLRRLVDRYAPPDIQTALRYVRDGGPAFPARNMTVTAAVPATPVLVLAPHPDDEIIGMGGTLRLHLANGSPVTILYLTDGAGLGHGRDARIRRRRAEAEAVGHACGVEQLFWDTPDTELTNDGKTVDALIDVLGAVRPGCVYLPSLFDRHYDHLSTNALLADALRRSPGADVTVLGYEVWDNVPFQNYVVDVSRHMEEKRALMRLYRTPLEVTDFVRLCECRGATHYMLYVDSGLERGGDGYAEAFCRLDAATYVQVFDGYVGALREHRSPMLRHLAHGVTAG